MHSLIRINIFKEMSFSLGNNPIADKIRESMYLKHLREVERINNRQPDSLKKELMTYRSISQLHRHNKVKANQRKLDQQHKSIQLHNLKIHNKIMTMESDEKIKQTKRESEQGNPESLRFIPNQGKKSLHYRYRKQKQNRIEEQNEKLKKAIEGQRSTLLPLLGNRNQNKNMWNSTSSTKKVDKTS